GDDVCGGNVRDQHLVALDVERQGRVGREADAAVDVQHAAAGGDLSGDRKATLRVAIDGELAVVQFQSCARQLRGEALRLDAPLELWRRQRARQLQVAGQRAAHVGDFGRNGFEEGEAAKVRIDGALQGVIRTADGDVAIDVSAVVQCGVQASVLIRTRCIDVDADAGP